MRYLGGKTKISKYLAAELNKYRSGLPFWDPFCGSLAMSCALGGPGIASDINPVLISLYRAILEGWEPPETLSKEEWQAAKSLPDSNPLKGFAGFACSYRGLYFSGYAGGYVGPSSREGAIAAKEVLCRDIALLKVSGVAIEQIDFLSVEPKPGFFLYLDPPYKGTAEYKGTQTFNHEAFYRRALEWSRFGPVLVSEYSLPIGREVWSKTRKSMLTTGSGDTRTEKLFLVQS